MANSRLRSQNPKKEDRPHQDQKQANWEGVYFKTPLLKHAHYIIGLLAIDYWIIITNNNNVSINSCSNCKVTFLSPCHSCISKPKPSLLGTSLAFF